MLRGGHARRACDVGHPGVAAQFVCHLRALGTRARVHPHGGQVLDEGAGQLVLRRQRALQAPELTQPAPSPVDGSVLLCADGNRGNAAQKA